MVDRRGQDTLRGRMSAWDRSFAEAHGRHPDEREWASAARMVCHLTLDQADALANETYRTYGREGAAAPMQPDFAAFAEAIIARRDRRAHAPAAPVPARPAHPHLARAAPLIVIGLVLAAWAARRDRHRPAA